MSGDKEIIMIPATKNRKKPLGLKRVAAYCRVSTSSDEQINSYESQIRYYRHKITTNPDWIFVGMYADKGISGTGSGYRPQFEKMIQDCERGEIDLILVKSISRFYRNTAECIVMVRKLRELRVGILFEKEGIDTMKERDEFWLTILSSFAQSESETLSRNLKLGYRQAFQAGTFKVNFKRLYGYKLTP